MSNAFLRIAGIVDDSIVDGPGLRFSIFTQGCPHHCPDCHNPQTHDPNAGECVAVSALLKKIDANPLLSGITLTGGEPLLQAKACACVARASQKRGLSVILYTGHVWEELLLMPHAQELLQACDWVVDGPYIASLKNATLRFKGSSNQRIIDVRESLRGPSPVFLEAFPESDLKTRGSGLSGFL